ncbi:hypothetical protein SAMN05192545_3952 [Maribacter dokdonensis]|uniref:Uncharacterized protein n=1 Tax=Maribacter dokdonensis TaxID=320912 RepID=A0ABY0V0N4_9FLAO|nr:hypothetical protein [Maribacter dokdonensis]SDT47860.1 hypothetical protein SAMN05192545_3952 [Maribacter dokdonensis]
MTDKEKLIESIVKRKKHLSYSWLKNFDTPQKFLDYKLNKKQSNNGMIFGSVCDVLLLTPGEFDDKFLLADKVPTTEIQHGFANELITVIECIGKEELTEEIIEQIFDNHYKSGKALKVYAGLEKYIDAKSEGKEVISNSVYDKAKTTTEKLLKFDDVALLMERKRSAQRKMVWTEQSFPMIAFTDFDTPESIFDLKFDNQCDPVQFEKTIYNRRYDLQSGTYVRGAMALKLFEGFPQYHFLVYNDTGEYFITELDPAYIMYGMRQLDYYIDALKRCIKNNTWDQSYNFLIESLSQINPVGQNPI